MTTTFPQDRLVFALPAPGQTFLSSGAGGIVDVYVDQAATTLATITTVDGALIPGARLIVGPDSTLPLFKDPADHSVLWAKPRGATTTYRMDPVLGDIVDARVPVAIQDYLDLHPISSSPSNDAGNRLREGTDGALVVTVADFPEIASLQTAVAAKVDQAALTTAINTASTADRQRSNHTGSQAISTVSGLQAALDGKQPVGDYASSSALAGKVDSTDPRLTDARTPLSHSHPVAQISDSTSLGRSLLQAASADAARTAIGAGTSNLALGTTSSTAKAGNWTPDWSEITNRPATFAPIIGTTASTAKAGNYVPAWSEITGKPTTFTPTTGLTAGTAKPGDWAPAWGEVTGKPTTYPPIIGTTSTTAKAGDYSPSWGEISGKPTTFPPAEHTHDDRYVRTVNGVGPDASGNVPVAGTGTGGDGTNDHGALQGLLDDDHPQYFNQERGDARYLQVIIYQEDYDTFTAGIAASRERANHTGTQAISTITGLQSALDGIQTGKQDAGDYATSDDLADGLAGKVDTTDPRLTDARTPTAHTHPSTGISDSTAVGRSLMTATDASAARSAIGAGTSNLALGTTSSTAKRGDYAPTSTDISDATATGRAVLTSADPTAARTAIGAGTSNLALGTTSTTAKAGDYAPTSTQISDATSVGRALLTATDAAAARAAIGAGTGSGTGSVASTDITDSTAVGRSVLTAADAAAARTAIGAGTGNSNLTIGTTSSTAKAGDYAPTSTDISDSTATGRSVLTAASSAAARSAIGAGTSSLTLGTTSSTAKAGDYQPTAAQISDATSVGRSVLTSTDAAAARTAIGAGTSNLALGTTSSTAKAGDYQPTAANISDSTATGRAVLTATDAAAARTAIGAGTGNSNLALGTTSTTAKAGDYQPAAANISDSTSVGRSVLTATDAAAARTAIGAAGSTETATALANRLLVATDSPLKPTDVWLCTEAEVPGTPVTGRLYLVFEEV